MSDVKGIEIHDIFGLSAPLTKLIETVSSGIGRRYEPKHIIKMAKAKAEEIKLIGEAELNSDLSVKYENSGLLIDNTDSNSLITRTNNRIAYQEIKKQVNIERTVGYAAQKLEKTSDVSDIPVNEDWITRFFDSVSDVSTDDMQMIWGKILAGEINTPGSFSLRTLNVLRNMNSQEAGLFSYMTQFVMFSNGSAFIPSDSDLFNNFSIPFGNIMALDECGLIYSKPVSFVGEQTNDYDECIYISNKKVVFETSTHSDFVFPVHAITKAGIELISIMEYTSNDIFFEKFLEELVYMHKGGISAKVYDLKTNEFLYNIKYGETQHDQL